MCRGRSKWYCRSATFYFTNITKEIWRRRKQITKSTPVWGPRRDTHDGLRKWGWRDGFFDLGPGRRAEDRRVWGEGTGGLVFWVIGGLEEGRVLLAGEDLFG